MANTFAVLVKAADYKDNDRMAPVEFTVVSKPQELGGLVLLKADKEIAIKGTMSASVLDGAVVAAVAKGAQPGEDGTYDSKDYLRYGTYSLSVKGKGVTIDGRENLLVTNPAAKNITITATARDGGNSKASLTIKQLTYDEKEELRLVMGKEFMDDIEFFELNEGKEKENELKVDGKSVNSGEFFEIRAVYTEDGKTANATRFQNYSIRVEGGARIYEDASSISGSYVKNQRLKLMVTDVSKPITLTLKVGSEKKIYILKSQAKEISMPSVTLDKNQTLVAGDPGKQILNFTVKGDVPENAEFIAGWADQSSENFFAGQDELLSYNRETKKISMVFENVTRTGSGSLRFAMKKPEAEGYVRSELGKPVKITVTSMKKTCTVTNKYTLSAMDQSEIPITYKGSNVYRVQFACYGANEKGRSNGFNEAIGFDDDKGTLKLTDKAEAGKTYTGYLSMVVIYADNSIAYSTSKLTVKVLADNKLARSYKADNVTLVKGKTSVHQACAMPVTIKAGKEEAEIVQAAEVTDKRGEAIPAIKVNSVENGKLSLDVSEFAAVNKEKGIQQEIMLKVVLAGAKDVKTPVEENKYAVSLKFKVVVPEEMLYEEERTEVTPEISFSSESPANRAADVTFTVNVKKEYSRQIKAFYYYTTDGTEPAIDAKGRMLGTTKKYAGKAVALPAPDTDEEQSVTVRVLAIAGDQTLYKNGTVEKSVTFAAKAQDGD